MLGKLIKNEFKGTSHSILFIYFAAAITVGLMGISFLLKLSWLSALCTLLLSLVSFAILLITIIAVITNFHKTLFGQQGYLSFTLPVSSGALLTSKVLVSFVWILLSYVAFLGIWAGIVSYLADAVGDEAIDTVKMVIEMFRELPDKGIVIKLLIVVAVTVFLTIASLIAKIYFSITISNTKKFQHYGTFFAIVIFFVVYIGMSIISVILTEKIPLKAVFTTQGVSLVTDISQVSGLLFQVGIVGLLFDMTMVVVMFIVTAKLMKSKVNVK